MKNVFLSMMIQCGWLYVIACGALGSLKASHRIDINKRDQESFTRLHRIVDSYHENRDTELDTLRKLSIVRQLVAAKADPNALITQGAKKGMSPLSLAVSNNGNNMRLVRLLLELKADVNQRVPLPSMELTPCALAIHKGRRFITLLLLDYKADINAPIRTYESDDGDYSDDGTLLHMLARSQEAEKDEDHFLKDLLEAGADYITYDKQRKTPLALYKSVRYEGPAYGRQREQGAFAQRLREHWDALYAQCKGVLYTDLLIPHVIITLITDYLKDYCLDPRPPCGKRKADGMDVSWDVNKRLEEALHQRNLKVIKESIRRGANLINIPGKSYSPLHVASYFRHEAVVIMLLDAGAKVNSTADKGGNTPLHLAAAGGCKMIVELLINAGANIRAINTYGRTPLHSAAIRGRGSIVWLFLNEGACKNVQDKDGNTPLHLAVQQGYPDVVEILLAAGADRGVKNKHKKMPLQLAYDYGHNIIVQMLIATSLQYINNRYVWIHPDLILFAESPWRID